MFEIVLKACRRAATEAEIDCAFYEIGSNFRTIEDLSEFYLELSCEYATEHNFSYRPNILSKATPQQLFDYHTKRTHEHLSNYLDKPELGIKIHYL